MTMAPHRILIADDDVDALRLVGLMLERKGYQIVAAANGHQTIQKAIELQPDLVVLDLMMPDMDGYDVAATLRAHPATEGIPILMFTAKTTVTDRIAGYQAGADDYLTKPVHPDDLALHVEALLNRAHAAEDRAKQGTIIAFLPSKGGLGTSTLALNTATEIQRMEEDKRVILVELREGHGTLAFQAGVSRSVQNGQGLREILSKPLSALNRRALDAQIVGTKSGFDLLPSAINPTGVAPALSKNHAHTILRFLASEYDFLVMDLPPCLSEAYATALRLSDLVMVTLESTRVGMEMAQLTLTGLEALEIEPDRTKLVLIHRVPAPNTMSRTLIEKQLGRDMVAGIPPAPDLAYTALENGKPMVEIEPRGLVAQQVRRIIQSQANPKAPIVP